MLKHIIALALLVSLTGCATLIKSLQKPDMTKMTYIRDDKGRICIYHGVNISNYAKTSPSYLPWQTEADIAKMNLWGFNLTRLIVSWEAIEPIRDKYNETYLDSIVNLINVMGQHGIDVLVDVHQDLYCKKFTGNGFPEWTLDGVTLPPFKEQHPWNLNYTQPAVIEAYQHFWKSTDLKLRYIAMLKKLMERVHALDNVIGIDVMNEPFPGINLCFEKDILSPFYRQIQKMFQDQSYHKTIFFEPWMSTSSGIITNLTYNSGVFAPHYYDPICHEGSSYEKVNHDYMEKAVRIKIVEAQEFGTPILFGEIGIGKNVTNYKQYIKDYVDLSDQYTFGWTWYSYDKTTDESFGIVDAQKNEEENLKVLVRMYPQKIAGNSPQWILTDSTFTLTFSTFILGDASVIFVPESVTAVTTTGDFRQEGTLGYYVAKSVGLQTLVLKRNVAH